jgi:hypothetical protein
MKRITIAITFGLFAGVVCASGAFLGGILPFTPANLVWVLLNRAVMGFAVGASGLPLRWAWNGVVTGLVVGSVFSYSLYMNRGDVAVPLLNALVNGLFGLMIEFFTSVVFKAPAVAVEHRTGHAVSV